MQLTATTVRRATAAVLATAAISTGAALAAAGPASAATTGAGQIKVCSDGNYASYVVFPQRGGLSTVLVNPGTCLTLGHLGTSSSVEPIRVYGDTAAKSFLITTGQFRPSLGGTVRTSGTAVHPKATTPRV